MQRRAAVANAMAYHEAYGLGWQTWSKYGDTIRAITPAEVAAAASRYLDASKMITATVRPKAASPAALKKSKTKAPVRRITIRPRGTL
jgi:predicted Zn-dependent peptidase